MRRRWGSLEPEPVADSSGIGVSGTKKASLDNQLRVVTESLPGRGSVAIGVVVECGVIHESAGESGFAHLAEHVLFQGTKVRTALRIAREIDSLGGQVGAFTSRDYTCFHATVASDYTFQALDLLADVVQNATCGHDAVESEKRIVLREIGRLGDAPERRAAHALRAAVWGQHGLGRPVSGEAACIRRVNRDALAGFLSRHYTPNRILVVAAGDVNQDDFLSQVNDCFWRMSGHSQVPATAAPGWRAAAIRESAPVSQSYFCVGLPAPEYDHASRYGFHVADRVLGGGMSSRLYRKLREEQGLVYDIHSEYNAYRGAGLWLIEGSTAPELEAGVMASILNELDQIRRERPIDDDELWIAKKKLHSAHVLGAEDCNTVMSRIATQELYFGRSIAPAEILQAIAGVEREQLQFTLKSHLNRWLPDVSVACVGPEETGAAERALVTKIEEFRPRAATAVKE